jgi:ankyrin repeat protein
VERHADVAKPDTNGRTALHVAGTQGQAGVVQLLLRNKARVDAEDLEGQSVIRACIATLYDKKVDIAKAALCLEHLVRHLDDEIHRKQRRLATIEKPANALADEEEVPRPFFSQDTHQVDEKQERKTLLQAMLKATEPRPAGQPSSMQAAAEEPDDVGDDCEAIFSSRRSIKLRNDIVKQATEMHHPHEAPVGQAYSRALQINRWDRPTLQPIHSGVPDIGPIGEARTLHSVLHSAIGARDLQLVRQALTTGASARDGDCGGLAPLHKAAFHGDLELCKLLLDHAACPSTFDGEGQSALHMAALAIQPGVVKVLLQRKACVSMPNGEGATSLQALVAKLHSKEGISPENEGVDPKKLALVLETLARAQQKEYQRVTHALDVHETNMKKERAAQEERLRNQRADMIKPVPKDPPPQVTSAPPLQTAAPEQTAKQEPPPQPVPEKAQEPPKDVPHGPAFTALERKVTEVPPPPPAPAESPEPDFANMDVVSLCTYCEEHNIQIPDDCNTKRKLAIFVQESVRSRKAEKMSPEETVSSTDDKASQKNAVAG